MCVCACACAHTSECVCMYMHVCLRDATIYIYIDILPYRDTLGSDTVSIHISVVSIYRIS